jgi:polysaccharide deacetylase family protein (PEP-CTERM system associated)
MLTNTPSRSSSTDAVLNAMTVDVEEHFQVSAFDGVVPRHQWDRLESRVAANTERLLQIFDATGVRATFFVLGWVAERAPSLVRLIASLGHEIASHGYAHRLVYDQTPAAFREDIRRAKAVLEQASGLPVLGFRAPSYSVTSRALWALDVLIEEGFAYDASIFPIHHDRYGIPVSARHPYVVERVAGSLVEIPASTVRYGGMNLPVGGGGYFRIYPYALTKWGIDRINRVEGRPAVFYIHPWEVDPDQPRLEVGFWSRFRHYRNLETTEGRLRPLLADFRFGPIDAMLRPDSRVSMAAARFEPLPYLW